MNKKIIVALDLDDINKTLKLVKELKKEAYAFKIGHEFFYNFGINGYKKIYNICPKIFLDLKLHDIPNTVKEATTSAANLGADFLTIHIASTSDALIEASNSKGNTLQILGVSSALTSRAMSNSVSEEVNKEFKEAKKCGVDGVICPASEISKTKEIFDLIVTPGIRLKNDDKNDQKNVATPNFAINEGAKYIVMGRSIRNNLDYIINDLEL